MLTTDLPIPPPEMRALVGPVDPAAFDNPTGADVFPETHGRGHGAVFDFGCGCGRIARQLIQQQIQPRRYVGIDLHRGMVAWCRANLTPRASQFDFLHHDVVSLGFNPGTDKPDARDFPVADSSFDLVIAHSVFTHILEPNALHYLRECQRILRPDGMLRSTWFLFHKREYPMMQPFQNAIYINEVDPTNAVIFDRGWLAAALKATGLIVTQVSAPLIRGYQWTLTIQSIESGSSEADLPDDRAPYGSMPPPVPTTSPEAIGREFETDVGAESR